MKKRIFAFSALVILVLAIVTAVEKKQMLLFNPGAHRRPRGRETA